jgi:prepilin-type N-terminal cleavage/methylation domain-containing protein
MSHREIIGFTLIELLIVVAIIAILAAIAVPNFLEAQTRAKVSRTRADLRSAVTALEAYRIDHNQYPPHRGPGTGGFGEQEPVHVLNGYGMDRAFAFRTLSLRLSTPISYITSTAIIDVFKRGAVDPSPPPNKYESGDPTDLALAYHNIHQYAILQMSSGFFPDDFNNDYGYYRLFSLGPNRIYDGFGNMDLRWIYDPTNGTLSSGFIIRTQIDPQGEFIAIPDP